MENDEIDANIAVIDAQIVQVAAQATLSTLQLTKRKANLNAQRVV